jgi:hypothetical protein
MDMRIERMLEAHVAPMLSLKTSEATYVTLKTQTRREPLSKAFLTQQFYGKET